MPKQINMRISKKYRLVLLLLMFVCVNYAQLANPKVLEILKKSNESLEGKASLSYNSDYKLYAGYESNFVVEEYSGIVLKKNSALYFKIGNTEFVSFGKTALKISHDQKAIAFENSNDEDFPLSLGNYMDGFSSKLSETKDLYICELKPANISQFMFTKVIVHISKINYGIVKQELFFAEEAQRTDAGNKLISYHPRLEINFKVRQKKSTDEKLFQKENYFTKVDNKIILTKRLSGYKIFNSY